MSKKKKTNQELENYPFDMVDGDCGETILKRKDGIIYEMEDIKSLFKMNIPHMGKDTMALYTPK